MVVRFVGNERSQKLTRRVSVEVCSAWRATISHIKPGVGTWGDVPIDVAEQSMLHSGMDPKRRIPQIAESQHGGFTRGQAREVRYSDRMPATEVKHGLLVRFGVRTDVAIGSSSSLLGGLTRCLARPRWPAVVRASSSEPICGWSSPRASHAPRCSRSYRRLGTDRFESSVGFPALPLSSNCSVIGFTEPHVRCRSTLNVATPSSPPGSSRTSSPTRR